MRILAFLVIGFLFSQSSLNAQTQPWALDSCINYALENNIQIKQTELNIKLNQSNLTKSKAAVLPSVNGTGSYNLSYGSAVDPYTSQFVVNNTKSLNVGISASLTLFSGLKNYNTMEQDKYDLMAAMANVESVRNNVSLSIALAYLNILLSNELVTNAQEQLASTNLQIEKTKNLVDAGSLPQGNLLEIQAQAASEKLQLVNSQNQLINARLTLVQYLDLDTVSDFEIVVPTIEKPEAEQLVNNVNDIYNQALQLPQIKSAELKLQSAEKGQNIAYSYAMPSLSVSAYYGTGYSSARTKYEMVNGSPVAVDYPYGSQLSDNLSTSIGFHLSIPIFNNYGVNNAVTSSKINVVNQKYEVQLAKNQLYKEIQQAYTDANGAYEKYLASESSYLALAESFKYTQKKFDVGLVTATDYSIAKKNLSKAESDLSGAKYEFIFKKNVLNFYSGIPFSLK